MALALLTPKSIADNRENAIALFNFAETNYPELLQPLAPEVQEIQGFYVRYYSETDVYLGVQGDNIWAFGEILGPEIIYVGKLSGIITLAEVDITNLNFSNRRPSCTYYADDFFSTVKDIKRNIDFTGAVKITVEGEKCIITSNSIPNHDFHDQSAEFATTVNEVSAEFRIPINPVFASGPTAISLNTDNAVLLNGVKVDLLAAACFGVGNERIGCSNIDQPWRLDPMSPNNTFGTDKHSAHTQPNGMYHYHGNPKVLFEQLPINESPLVGFAADGFPIFGPYIDDEGQIRAVTSSYRLKSGFRPSGENAPGGSYDGTYIDDYEYVSSSGDLDICNGMMRNGVYGYYIIDHYPWVLRCYQGTPDVSFNKQVAGIRFTQDQ